MTTPVKKPVGVSGVPASDVEAEAVAAPVSAKEAENTVLSKKMIREKCDNGGGGEGTWGNKPKFTEKLPDGTCAGCDGRGDYGTLCVDCEDSGMIYE